MRRNRDIVLLLPLLAIGTILLLSEGFHVGCARSPEAEQENARHEARVLMNALLNAATERNAEKVIALCFPSPEFLFVSDGRIYTFDEFAKGERKDFQTMKNLVMTWDTLHVKVLCPDAVATLAPFHQVITDTAGNVTRLKGEVTWVAVRRQGSWRFLYGHARHVQDTTSE